MRNILSLINTYQNKIYNFAYYLCGRDEEKSKDLVQDVFLKILQNFKKLRSEEAFLQWSLKITKNIYLKKYANNTKEISLDYHEIMYLKEKKESNNSSSAKEELQDAILEGLKKLPPLWQFVFNLREIEGYSYKEIAKIANIRIGTVKSILNRSKNKLREFLKGKCY